MACNAHLGEVDTAREALAAAGCSVLVVSQSKPESLSLYAPRLGWHVPVVGDPDRAAYRAFGLERVGWLTFLRPGVVWGYVRSLFRGYRPRAPLRGEDALQLGGDFILDRQRRVVFAYPSADPTDRPSARSILDALRRLPSA
jgi:peroxiredoxin